jgi:hypothetical protein
MNLEGGEATPMYTEYRLNLEGDEVVTNQFGALLSVRTSLEGAKRLDRLQDTWDADEHCDLFLVTHVPLVFDPEPEQHPECQPSPLAPFPHKTVRFEKDAYVCVLIKKGGKDKVTVVTSVSITK